MIEFHRLEIEQKQAYDGILMNCSPRGCEYSFANQYLWGMQKVSFIDGAVALFSHFRGRSVYPYPIGGDNRRVVLEQIMLDARERGIPLRLVSLTEQDREELEALFPGEFYLCPDRDGADYVYDINDLADLKGKKFQKKRNHVHRFWDAHPDSRLVPLDGEIRERAKEMVVQWYDVRKEEDPTGDYILETVAMARAFRKYDQLGLEGCALMDGDEVLAVTIASRLSQDTYDVHFEKGREDVEGAYPAINQEFARYLREKHPEIRFLNREDDMGLAGLRKAKLSYCPHHMEEKFWAYRKTDGLMELDDED